MSDCEICGNDEDDGIRDNPRPHLCPPNIENAERPCPTCGVIQGCHHLDSDGKIIGHGCAYCAATE